MCGIWALVNMIKNTKSLKDVDMAKHFADFLKLKNRGPDNTSFETFSNAWVGFHRLAIMDTSFDSNQPFIIKDELRTIVFVCNGEIYNFRELIQQYDLPIEHNSDCLTIPQLYYQLTKKDGDKGYLKWEKLFKEKIKGEYAFIVLEFDNLNNLRKVVACRDQIGIRPLYYHPYSEGSKIMLFSSEIKGTISFDGEISEFPPGQIITYNLNEFGNTSTSVYDFNNVYNQICHPFALTNTMEDSEQTLLALVRNAVINSVRRRLDADRPLAFLLSGGVDSSLVVAISAKILGQPVNTFCCGMKEGTDLFYARKVAKHIGSNHTEVFFTEDEGLNAIPDVVYTTETWDTTTIRASVGQYMVSKYIGTKTDCRVVLVGEGPDEVCSSYLFNWYAPSGDALHQAALDYVKEIHLFDSRRGDRCLSHWGLEGRVPLLDPEVIKAYWSIPARWRTPNYKGIEKWWLRKAFDGLGLLPDEVLWRKKEAFSDGVSGTKKSWYSIIQEKCDKKISDQMLSRTKWSHCPPPTKEAYYYRSLFTDSFGMKYDNIIPHYWQPRWSADGEEVKQYIDPSARVLEVYQ